MKKTILIILICWFMVLGFTGCSKSSKVPNDAEVLDYDNVHMIVEENRAKITDYEGKWYKVTGVVSEIDSEYCLINNDKSGGYYTNYISAYMSNEELKTLNKGDVITVIGQLSEVGGFNNAAHSFSIENATIIEKLDMTESEFIQSEK